jgi:hypothetical protein
LPGTAVVKPPDYHEHLSRSAETAARKINPLTVAAVGGDEAVAVGLSVDPITRFRTTCRQRLVEFGRLQARFSAQGDQSAVIHGNLPFLPCSDRFPARLQFLWSIFYAKVCHIWPLAAAI